MMPVVFDANVIVSGAGWRGEAHVCLVAMARRRARVFTSEWILEEAGRILAALRQGRRLAFNPWPVFEWFADCSPRIIPMPLGKQRSRDAQDDSVLGPALAARAPLVSYDQDLLAMKKPFGVEIITPRQFLTRIHRPI